VLNRHKLVILRLICRIPLKDKVLRRPPILLLRLHLLCCLVNVLELLLYHDLLLHLSIEGLPFEAREILLILVLPILLIHFLVKCDLH
jgi:hypothetical protein